MVLSFQEKIQLESNNFVMIYRCKKGELDFFSYVLCDAEGVKNMREDFESGAKSQPYDYGKIIYSDFLKNPDAEAEAFLQNWLAENSGESLSSS